MHPRALNLAARATVDKQDKRGNGAHPEPVGQVWALVNVDLGKRNVRILLRQGLKHRRKVSARPTPGRPKVDKHKCVALHEGVKRVAVELADHFTYLPQKGKARAKSTIVRGHINDNQLTRLN
jgi:hypothetical protein